MELTPGTILQNYTIIRPLGDGGMGEVYLAEETFLGRQVAIKRLNPNLTKDTQFSERFINEARIQAKLIHPHIVALYNFFAEAGFYYMVMEYAEGIMLKELIARTGPIPEQRTLHIFQQLISALSYAHSKEIIHRDIKPSNIMIDTSDNIKVMDFGIARLLSDKHLTQTGAKLGTLFYMSPEQIMADKNIDPRSDIYSAGIVLYEMLTGRLPYQADTDSDFMVMKEITEVDTPDPRAIYPHISDQTVNLLTELTAKDKQYRPDTGKVITRLEQLSGKTTARRDAHSKPLAPQPVKETKPDLVPPDSIEPAQFTGDIAESELEPPVTKTHTIRNVVLVILASFLPVILMQFCSANKSQAEEAPVDSTMVSTSADAKTTKPTMVLVEGGTFTMGDTAGGGGDDEKPTHSVTLSSFYLGKYEVTQRQWQDVMGSNPSNFNGGDLPVETVSWYDCVEFCNKLSQKEGLTPCYSGSGENITCDWTANGYRLPTEAEWEYAAKGGKQSKGYKYAGSNDLGSVAWYDSNSGSKTHAVGGKQANELGIYDMSGNVWEWNWDWYGTFTSVAQTNPHGVVSGSYRVLRGGGWSNVANGCTVSSRSDFDATYSNYNIGFRCVRVSP